MLEEFHMPILEEQHPDDILLQQDGAPTHFHREVKDFSNRKFPEKYIGGRWPITWPPCAPDFTRPEFFFWWYIKICCVRATIGYHLAGNCWKDKRCSGYSFSRLT
jgi:hypothetical protein